MMTYPIDIVFSPYAIIGLTLFILAASIAIYLLRIPKKSRATWSIMGFFMMVAISGFATVLTNAFFFWDRLFTPWQDFWILAGGISLAHLAYSVPHYENSSEARLVLGITSLLAFLALVYCILFDYQFLFHWTPSLDVHDAFYLLLPVGTLLILLVFLRRSLYFSRQAEPSIDSNREDSLIYRLIHPRGSDAKAFRNLALALSLAFLPGFQTLFGLPNPYGFILSNIGSILAIIALTLVYLNYSPEVESFMAKLVGIALATVVFILAIFGTVDLYYEGIASNQNRYQIIASAHNALLDTGDLSFAHPEISYVISWNASDRQDATDYRLLYLSDQESKFNFDTLINRNHSGYLETHSYSLSDSLTWLTNDDWQMINRYQTYPQGSNQADYLGYIFEANDTAYEIGISLIAIGYHISLEIIKYLLLILASSAFILLIFPQFLKQTLVVPLNNLLRGISRVDQGDMDTPIPVNSNDEIGLLTQSFNRMVRSLKEATYEIQNRALYLEAEVSERTVKLIQANVKLEKENQERISAEAKLNQQLLYQKALANCSQTLLVSAKTDSEQQKILNQALDHLRSAAATSRAYIFYQFDDPELGACIGMQAEVCAPGIPDHIHNPVNQKFPISSLPAEMLAILLNGNPFGGPVRELFSSTPVLRDSFVNQEPPLLSLIFFPIFDSDQLYGFVGFDECEFERQWGEEEVSILRTASEMIVNTLKRWDTEAVLRKTLSELELRVQKRTASLTQSNLQLNEEIQRRKLFQNDLEQRLQIEGILAKISSRLLEPTRIRENIVASLEELGDIIEAQRIFLIDFDLQETTQVKEFFEWHIPGIQPISEEHVQRSIDTLDGLRNRLRKGETIYIEDVNQYPTANNTDTLFLKDRGIQSLVLSPLTIDHRVHGILGCSNLQPASGSIQANIQILELVAGMLKSLHQREHLIQTLEEQVMERTQQLTTFLDVAMLNDQAQKLADILQPSLLSIIQIASCDACSIHLIYEKVSKLELVAHRGIFSDDLLALNELEMDEEFLGWLKKEKPYESYRVSEVGPSFPDLFCLPGFSTFIGSRLRTGEKTLGLLSCFRTENQPFSTFQETILIALGELLGIIVENHRLRVEAEELATIEERQRLAREIHDAISQSVYSLSLFARSARDAQNEENQPKLISNLDDIETTALQAMREMRLLLYQLREIGQERDIETALTTRFKQVENRLGIKTTLEMEEHFDIPAQVQHEVWRIIIEALNNIIKHAQATQVTVQLICRGDRVHLSIQDDGIGFDPQFGSAGMGLKNIRTRAETLQGHLEIISAPNRGTEIRIDFPINCQITESRG